MKDGIKNNVIGFLTNGCFSSIIKKRWGNPAALCDFILVTPKRTTIIFLSFYNFSLNLVQLKEGSN